ncbi:hypothetical protein HNQ56_000857 [Anaerotaenia torta]|uniref:polymorphic toxin type 30 domain-containing protein n=1 Tax=Anaerotaenia torta TaxID=433293 RepID=UPI003D2100A4
MGDFNGISGLTLGNVLSRVPAGAEIKPFTPDSSLKDGIRVKWSDNGIKYELLAHEANTRAPEGSNSSKGWTLRIKKSGFGNGKWYINSEGQWVKDNVVNERSPMYDAKQANSTHIEIQNPYDNHGDDDNDKTPPINGGGQGGGLSETDKILANESGDLRRVDTKGDTYSGYFDKKNVWHDTGKRFIDGNSDAYTYVMPINPTIPNFTSFTQPAFVFGW